MQDFRDSHDLNNLIDDIRNALWASAAYLGNQRNT